MTLDALLAAFKSRAWYPFAGIALWLLLDLSKRVKIDWVAKIPAGWRWLVPVTIGAVTGFVDAYASGQRWQTALLMAGYGAIAVGVPSMGVQDLVKESILTGGGQWGGPGGGPIPLKRDSDRPTDPAPPSTGVSIKRVEVAITGDKNPAVVSDNFRRALGRITLGILVVLGALVAVPILTACQGDKAQAAMVQRTEALALNGATLAFEIIKAEERHRVDAIAKPTEDELAVMDRRLEQIKRVEAALNLAQDYVAGKKDGSSRQSLADALDVLTLLAEELKADGVKLPDRAVEGLKLAALFVKVGS